MRPSSVGPALKCEKCGDIIQSKSVHDFKWCKCRNVFIDGGGEYIRIGGAALEDNSYSFITKED